jgi:DNA recombination protein RmuC
MSPGIGFGVSPNALLLALSILLVLSVGTCWYWRRRSRALELQLRELQAQHQNEQQLEQAREQALQIALERAKAAFDQVADQSLRSNTELFLKLAREHLGQHQQHSVTALSQREQAIEAMLAPIREALGKTEQQIQRIEKDRAESFGSLRTALETVVLGQQALQRETRTLVNALRRPEVRGQWGELTLRRLVELAGMLEHCDFNEQVTVRGEQGLLRPDMIVHMPDGRDLVVDVKTPLDAYLEAIEAVTDEQRATALARHAAGLRERVRHLASKNYWSQFEKSPDFVILFIPGDQFLSAALAELPTLLEDAIRQNVIIVTPSSCIALLKAVAYGWRQTALANNAATIRTLGEELYKRLVTFTSHLGRLGRSLAGSVEAFNSAVGSFERQVLPGARKFTELGVRPDRPIEPGEPIEKLVRAPLEPPAAESPAYQADAAAGAEPHILSLDLDLK